MHADQEGKKEGKQFRCIIILPGPIRVCRTETKLWVSLGLFQWKTTCFTLKSTSKKVMVSMRFYSYLLKWSDRLLFRAFCIFYVHHLLRPQPRVRRAGNGSSGPGAGGLALSWCACLFHKSVRMGMKHGFPQVRGSLKKKKKVLSVSGYDSAPQCGGQAEVRRWNVQPPSLSLPWENEEKWKFRVALTGSSDSTQPSFYLTDEKTGP